MLLGVTHMGEGFAQGVAVPQAVAHVFAAHGAAEGIVQVVDLSISITAPAQREPQLTGVLPQVVPPLAGTHAVQRDGSSVHSGVGVSGIGVSGVGVSGIGVGSAVISAVGCSASSLPGVAFCSASLLGVATGVVSPPLQPYSGSVPNSPNIISPASSSDNVLFIVRSFLCVRE